MENNYQKNSNKVSLGRSKKRKAAKCKYLEVSCSSCPVGCYTNGEQTTATASAEVVENEVVLETASEVVTEPAPTQEVENKIEIDNEAEAKAKAEAEEKARLEAEAKAKAEAEEKARLEAEAKAKAEAEEKANSEEVVEERQKSPPLLKKKALN